MKDIIVVWNSVAEVPATMELNTTDKILKALNANRDVGNTAYLGKGTLRYVLHTLPSTSQYYICLVTYPHMRLIISSYKEIFT